MSGAALTPTLSYGEREPEGLHGQGAVASPSPAAAGEGLGWGPLPHAEPVAYVKLPSAFGRGAGVRAD
jgi:hypothetical protein